MTREELESLANRIRQDPDVHVHETRSLSESDQTSVVQLLKAEADHHWGIDPTISLHIATCIQKIGEVCEVPSIIGLGMMARGDALNHMGQAHKAWIALDEAGHFFRQHGDDYGWARTWIGRLPLSVAVYRSQEALSNVDEARRIFIKVKDYERLMRLEMHVGILYDLLTEYKSASDYHTRALRVVEDHPEISISHRAKLHLNIGYSKYMMGALDQAREAYIQARTIFESLGHSKELALTQLNIANIDLLQGHYLEAYRGLLNIDDPNWPMETNYARLGVINCLVAFGDYHEVVRQARALAEDLKQLGSSYYLGLTLMHLADAYINLKALPSANAVLRDVHDIFEQVGASDLVTSVLLRKAQAVLTQGDVLEARRIMTEAITQAPLSESFHLFFITLPGQIALAEGNLTAAEQEAQDALKRVSVSNMPSARYAVELLFANIAEQSESCDSAIEHYQSAMDIIERLQQGLGINTRPLFLESHDTPHHALIRLYLQQGQTGHEKAFLILERLKSQVLAQYLTSRDRLRRSGDDERIKTLVGALNQLRGRFNVLMQASQGGSSLQDALSVRYPVSANAGDDLATLERQMRRLSSELEALGYGQAERMMPPEVGQITASLPRQTVVIAYYNDGTSLTAFVMTQAGLHVQRLAHEAASMIKPMDDLQRWTSVAAAVQPDKTLSKWLLKTREALNDLYNCLLLPLKSYLKGARRLIIVPYGALHGLPFHLLYDGKTHLIEQYEVVISPTASLIPYPGPRRQMGALALTNSDNGLLSHTKPEADMVIRRYGGDAFHNQEAHAAQLRRSPRQILHIAAHGKHDPATPHLSYIQFADSILYSDELLQYDLSYELVTLSACETGRARPSGGDELIGIGRGFLYSGAGSLVTSLWRVNDKSTAWLMRYFYAQLHRGKSKASALRSAQRTLLKQTPDLHPAFWGAFQLIGDPNPLTKSS